MSYNPYRRYCKSWWRHWFNLPRDIRDFLGRLRDYIPLLWEDRDWDFDSMLNLMRFKLRRVRKHIEGHASVAHAEDVVAELARADVLLRNVVDEDPDDEWSAHCSQWHHGDTLGDCGAPPGECKKACGASMARTFRNWHALWRYIDKHAQGWWD